MSILYPSIDTLVKKEPSTYSLIILASKRAHDIKQYKNYQLDKYKSAKPVGMALEELAAGVLEQKDQ